MEPSLWGFENYFLNQFLTQILPLTSQVIDLHFSFQCVQRGGSGRVWRSEGNWQEWALSFHHGSPGDWAQVPRLGGKRLGFLTHLAGSICLFFCLIYQIKGRITFSWWFSLLIYFFKGQTCQISNGSFSERGCILFLYLWSQTHVSSENIPGLLTRWLDVYRVWERSRAFQASQLTLGRKPGYELQAPEEASSLVLFMTTGFSPGKGGRDFFSAE